MESVFERIAQLNQESFQVSRRIALAACESFDEWMKAQMDASRELVQRNAAGPGALRQDGVPAALTRLPAAYERYWQKTFESARDWVEAGVRTQSAFTAILFEQANAANTAIKRIAEDSTARAASASDALHQRTRERPRQAA